MRIFAMVIVAFVFVLAGCGGPEDEATEGRRSLVVGLLEGSGDATAAAGALYGCSGSKCQVTHGKQLAAAVDRATQAVEHSMTEIDDPCVREAGLTYLKVFSAYRFAAIHAQAGQMQQMFRRLDGGGVLAGEASRRLLACGGLTLDEQQLTAGLQLRAAVETLYAIDDVMSRCETPRCVKRQGELMRQQAGSAVTRFDGLLEVIDLASAPPRCQDAFKTIRKVLMTFGDAGDAARLMQINRLVTVGKHANALLGQYQDELRSCAP